MLIASAYLVARNAPTSTDRELTVALRVLSDANRNGRVILARLNAEELVADELFARGL